MEPIDRIIWSADVESQTKLFASLATIVPQLNFVKLDRFFLTGVDLKIIREVYERTSVRVFVDAKIIEIPSKMEALAKKYVAHKPWMLNCMAGGLSSGVWGYARDGEQLDGLRRFADVCLEAEVKPCGVTVLTSKSPLIVMGEFKRTPEAQVLFYVEKLVKAGFTDVVCSPREVASIIAAGFGSAITINCPGIRLPDAKADDQARIATPSGAVAAGADRLVIGRPITNGHLSKIVDDLVSAPHGTRPSSADTRKEPS